MRKNDASAPVIRYGDDVGGSSGGVRSWLPKITCLLLAFIIWVYVMQVDSPEHEETFYAVEVTLINTTTLEGQKNLSVYSGYGNTVDVTVIGQKSVISKLSVEDIKITADVSQLSTAGLHFVDLQVELPSGISLGSVSQNSIQVYCDEKASTVVDVRARITSFTMESRLEMGELEVSYDTIIVSGPKETLDSIRYAQVNLELGNISASMNATGKLILVDEDGREIENPYLRMSRSDVSVFVPVYTTKTLPLTVAYKYGFFHEDNVKIEITPASVNVRGDPEVLDALTEIVVATLDEKKISGNITQMFQLELPDSVTTVDGTENVTLDVTHINTFATVFYVTDIDVIGAQNVEYQILENSIAVMVRGTLEDLRKLRSSDFSAIVDLSGYSAQSSGVIREMASIRIDSALAENVYEIGEYTVQVKLN